MIDIDILNHSQCSKHRNLGPVTEQIRPKIKNDPEIRQRVLWSTRWPGIRSNFHTGWTPMACVAIRMVVVDTDATMVPFDFQELLSSYSSGLVTCQNILFLWSSKIQSCSQTPNLKRFSTSCHWIGGASSVPCASYFWSWWIWRERLALNPWTQRVSPVLSPTEPISFNP